MTLILNLSADQEAAIRRQATEHGLDPEGYVMSLVDETILFEGFEPIPEDDPQERDEAAAGIQLGLDDFAAGRHRPASEAFEELRTRHGLRRRS